MISAPGTSLDAGPLETALRALEQRVSRVVAHRRADDPAPDDPFRGLYVTDETVDRLLAPRRATASRRAVDDGPLQVDPLQEPEGRLAALARAAELTPAEVDILLIALAPDVDARFERLYGYLNDDVSRRRASTGLALELAQLSPLDPWTRQRFDVAAPLVRAGLLVVDDDERPFLTRSLRVPDRVTSHLTGADQPDPVLAPFLEQVRGHRTRLAVDLAPVLASAAAPVYLREKVAGSAAALAVAALEATGRVSVVLDARRAGSGTDLVEVVAVASREALLRGGGLVLGPVEALAAAGSQVLQLVATLPGPLAVTGSSTWDPQWSHRSPLLVDVPVMSTAERLALWSDALRDQTAEVDPAELAGHLALGPGQVRQAVAAAEVSAELHGGPITRDDLRLGIRAQNAAGLERLARRIQPEVSWDDLVLGPVVTRGLQDLAARARHRDLVLSDWRMRRGGGRGHGVTALFAGDSGTGKTMSAEVIAAALGLDLYTVNLATVVDKYIGETEKNLERIFVEAGGVNAVLFFDEADAIFGKRSDVRDAHDRYANIESAYLLQRLETFDGLAVLATNLRANIDDAFTRRLDAIIDFPAPTAELRRRLWQQCLREPLPTADDIDLDFLADAFELAGGNIRSASTTAAYLAAQAGCAVGMAEVIAAVEQEYRKLGRLVMEREFGRYLPVR